MDDLNVNYPDEERVRMIGSFLDDEMTGLNMDLMEEVSLGTLKSSVMLDQAKRCMNRIEMEIMRLMHGDTADIESCMKNIGLIYFTFRNRENALCYATGKRMAEMDELERRLTVCGKKAN